MKQKLTLVERFVLLTILPTEGNFATLKVVRKLRESLSLTEEEIIKYEVTTDNEQIKWNSLKAKDDFKEIEFSDFSEDLIKSKLRKLNEENKLEENHFTLYEKFIDKNGG